MKIRRFIEVHLNDSVDDDYRDICNSALRELDLLEESIHILEGLLLKQYSSIDDFEKEKKNYFI